MKTIIIFLMTIGFCTAQQTDYIKTKDFNLHVYAGATTATLGAIINDATELGAPNWAAHLGTAVAIGTLKETWDVIADGERFSAEDWAATLAGGTFSWIADEIFKWLGIERYTRVVVIVGGLVGVGLTVNLK